MSQGMFLAKALYDNIAETPDELAFRRGDVVTVVEQEPGGLEGWWYCEVRGRHGIAPGNRLKILSGMGSHQGSPNASLDQSNMDLYDSPTSGQQDYDVPPPHRGNVTGLITPNSSARRGSRESLRSTGSRGNSLGDDLYDTPPSSKRVSAESASGGLYDTPPSSKRASHERTPPHSNRSSASRELGLGSNSNIASGISGSALSLSSKHSGSNLSLQGTLRRRGSRDSRNDTYDTPPGSNRSSLERILTEEGPPVYDTLSPSTSHEQIDDGEATYDTPPTRTHVLHNASSASQMNLRSHGSIESLLSNTSGSILSGTSGIGSQLSHTFSQPDSARSSMDLPAETYDVPSSLHEGHISRKQISTDSGLGFYDSPVKSRPPSSNSAHSEGLRPSQSAFDCKSSSSMPDVKRSKSVDNCLDDTYDVPRSNAPKMSCKKSIASSGYGSSLTINDTSGVYDIPPQVTRDSVISSRSDSSDENQRFSSSSLESDQHMTELPFFDEIFLDMDSALEVLTKRQQDVNKATARICAFVNDTWRTRSSLEKSLYDIRTSCSFLKKSLNDYVTFSNGAVTNSSKHADKQLANKLSKMIIPVQGSLTFVNRSFNNLEEMKWQVDILCEPFDKNKMDNLGQIALVARDLMPEVKRVSSFIQSNSCMIFRRAQSVDMRKPPVSAKPPIGPKADINSKMPIYTKPKSMQHRPLPQLPGRSLPELPGSDDTPSENALPASKVSSYESRLALQQDDYAEPDELIEEQLKEIAEMTKIAKMTKKDIMEQTVQEYDYVQLDALDALASGSDPPKNLQDTMKHTHAGEGEPEVKTPTNKNVVGSYTTTNVNTSFSELYGPLANLSLHDDVDMVPVRDTGSGAPPSASSTLEKKPSPEKSTVQDRDFVDSAMKSEPPSPETELTPVNRDSSDTAPNFILPSGAGSPELLDPNDRQVLAYYTDQINTHSDLLNNAVDAFIGVVGNNQPPNVFISHGKFVIVSAHKLVYIGDSIHRNLISNSISTRIMQCANLLCDCLKASVTATKTAALQYPSVPAVQDMVNKVVAVSHAATDLRTVITQSL